jgi:uncharacterized protein YhaN
MLKKKKDELDINVQRLVKSIRDFDEIISHIDTLEQQISNLQLQLQNANKLLVKYTATEKEEEQAMEDDIIQNDPNYTSCAMVLIFFVGVMFAIIFDLFE